MSNLIELNDILKLNNMSFVSNIKQLINSINTDNFDRGHALNRMNINILEEIAFSHIFEDKSIYDYIDSSYMFNNGKIRIIYVKDSDIDFIKVIKFQTNSKVRVGETNNFTTIFCDNSCIDTEEGLIKLLDIIIRARIDLYLINSGVDNIPPMPLGTNIFKENTLQNMANFINYNICRISILDSVLNLKYNEYIKVFNAIWKINIANTEDQLVIHECFRYAITEDESEEDYNNLLRKCADIYFNKKIENVDKVLQAQREIYDK